MRLFETLGNDACLTSGLFDCYSGLESGNGTQVTRVAVRVHIGLRHWSVKLTHGKDESEWKRLEVRIHNANNAVWKPAERHCLADHTRVSAEPALPQAI